MQDSGLERGRLETGELERIALSARARVIVGAALERVYVFVIVVGGVVVTLAWIWLLIYGVAWSLG